jgi:hypothetical protein
MITVVILAIMLVICIIIYVIFFNGNKQEKYKNYEYMCDSCENRTDLQCKKCSNCKMFIDEFGDKYCTDFYNKIDIQCKKYGNFI